jgi:L,D-transpeptidase ErfK/SrfK
MTDGLGFRSPVRRPRQEELVRTVETHIARKEDTLLDLAVAHDLGYLEIVAANRGVDPWLPAPGTEVVLPKAKLLPAGPRDGIVINLPERRLYVFKRGFLVSDYPVGIGRDNLETPVGSTRIVEKRLAPTWRPTTQARREDPTLPAVVPPGPDNPLGTHALYLEWTNYLIHGTNRIYAIGRRASRGCIRLYPDDIVDLYKEVAVGTKVTVIDQPLKLGWKENVLYLEVHPTRLQGRELEEKGRFREVADADARRLILAAAGAEAERVEWEAVAAALRDRRGMPVPITRPTLLATTT